LKLAGILVLEESLSTTGFAWVPTELRSSSIVLGLLANDKRIPGFVDQRLVQKTIHNTRVHPVTFGHARLKVAGNMFDVALASWVKSRTKATGPVLAFSKELDYFLGVGTSLAAMTLLMMLVERVGSPKTAVTSRFGTRVLAPALVKLILVALPVVLALEARFTGRAPIDVRLASCTYRGTHRAKAVHRTGRGDRKRRL
jgi:hypothetical protein